MLYKIRKVMINNDGTVTEGKRTERFIWPHTLCVGGIYALRKHSFYRVLEILEEVGA